MPLSDFVFRLYIINSSSRCSRFNRRSFYILIYQSSSFSVNNISRISSLIFFILINQSNTFSINSRSRFQIFTLLPLSDFVFRLSIIKISSRCSRFNRRSYSILINQSAVSLLEAFPDLFHIPDFDPQIPCYPHSDFQQSFGPLTPYF